MRDAAPGPTRSTRPAAITQHPTAAVPVAGAVVSPVVSSPGFVERRNLQARLGLSGRIRDEFMEMPGTALTLPQASRLFGVPADVCGRIFGELIRSGSLTLADSRYRRHSAA